MCVYVYVHVCLGSKEVYSHARMWGADRRSTEQSPRKRLMLQYTEPSAHWSVPCSAAAGQRYTKPHTVSPTLCSQTQNTTLFAVKHRTLHSLQSNIEHYTSCSQTQNTTLFAVKHRTLHFLQSNTEHYTLCSQTQNTTLSAVKNTEHYTLFSQTQNTTLSAVKHRTLHSPQSNTEPLHSLQSNTEHYTLRSQT